MNHSSYNSSQEEATLLDSQFGASSDTEDKFAQMGLPQGRHQRKRKWLIVAILLGGAGLFLFQDQNPLKTQLALEKQQKREKTLLALEKNLASGKFEACRQVLSTLPLSDSLQQLVPWLKQMDSIDQTLAQRDWALAYDLIQKAPLGPESFQETLRKILHQKRDHTFDEIKASQKWEETDQDSLEEVRKAFAQFPVNSIYRQEAQQHLSGLEDQVLNQLQNQYEVFLAQEDWSSVEGVLNTAHTQLPDNDFTPWYDQLNTKREASNLYQRCRRHLLAGHFVTAMALIPEEPLGAYRDLLGQWRQGLLGLESKVGDLNAAFSLLEQGKFKKGLSQFSEYSQNNPVIDLIFNHWSLISKQYDEFESFSNKTIEEKIKKLNLASSLLQDLPETRGDFYISIQNHYDALTQDLKDHTNFLRQQLLSYWQQDDYLKAYSFSQKLLVIEADHVEARRINDQLQSVGRRLFDEIYILKNIDREFAQQRFETLKNLLPYSHNLIALGQSLLDTP